MRVPLNSRTKYFSESVLQGVRVFVGCRLKRCVMGGLLFLAWAAIWPGVKNVYSQGPDPDAPTAAASVRLATRHVSRRGQ